MWKLFSETESRSLQTAVIPKFSIFHSPFSIFHSQFSILLVHPQFLALRTVVRLFIVLAAHTQDHSQGNGRKKYG